MKTFTLRSMLWCVALVSASMAFAQQPEGTLLFTQDGENFTRTNIAAYPAHRGAPLIGDFNGDGIKDLYQMGTSCYYGWNTKGAPFEGNADGTFTARGGWKWDAENPHIEYAYEYEMEPVYETNEDGTVKEDEDGNPIQAVDENGDPKFETKKDSEGNPIVKVDSDGNPVILEDINGNDSIKSINYDLLRIEPETVSNPGASWNNSCVPIDFNQDGLLDFVVLNCGGENTGTKGEVYILKNLGNFQFEKFTCEAFNAVADGGEWLNNGDGNSKPGGFNENNLDGYCAVGDYDRDGYPDFILQSNHYDKSVAGPRNVTLFHNEGGETFTIADVFRPLPLDKEFCMARIYKKTEDAPDPDDPTGETMIPGVYTDQPNYKPRSLRSSNLVMADFNNDGWLDIVITGWYDGDNNAADPYNDNLNGGWGVAFYQNTKDGWFQDVTDKMIPMAGEVLTAKGSVATGTIQDVLTVYGSQAVIMVPVDWNQNGVMDLFMNYNAGGFDYSIVLNGVEGEDMTFTHEDSGLPYMYWSAERTKFFADMNGDDVMDLLMFGGSRYYRDDNSYFDGWASLFCTSNNGQPGDYTIINFEDGERPEEQRYNVGFSRNDGSTMVYGDVNNDGLIDAMYQVWTGGYVLGDGTKNADGTDRQSCEQLYVSFNTTPGAKELLMAPGAPDAVYAEEVEGEPGAIQVYWDQSALLLGGTMPMFNLYIKNVETGKRFMLVPACETGEQMGYQGYGGYVSAGSASEPSYKFVKMPEGEYEIGVQAVNPAYLGSEFTTTTITVTNGFDGVASSKIAQFDVDVDGNTVTVNAAEDGEVAIYAVSGAEVATGRTNQGITVNGKGVFVVKANGQSMKIVK